MPRPKKGSPEAKEWAAKMQAKREAAKQDKPTNTVQNEPIEQPSPSAPQTISDDTVQELLNRIKELENRQFFNQAQPVVKAVTKFSVTPHDYPDPRERLSDEPKLQEHAFKQNFTLKWEIGRTGYEKDGVSYTEPKFDLEVWRWLRDEDGELTDKQYRVHRLTFHEDPEAAIQMARDKGLDVDETLQRDFLDEMRYLRMRDWLLEIFYPPKTQANQQTREEVIGNRLVPVLEVNSFQAVGIPIDKLKV